MDTAIHDSLDQWTQILVLDSTLRLKEARFVAAKNHGLILQYTGVGIVHQTAQESSETIKTSSCPAVTEAQEQ